eukprot:PhM_4_TR18511/c0_g1_i2/m.5583
MSSNDDDTASLVYLQQQHIPELFESILEHLLTCKPKNVLRSMRVLLKAQVKQLDPKHVDESMTSTTTTVQGNSPASAIGIDEIENPLNSSVMSSTRDTSTFLMEREMSAFTQSWGSSASSHAVRRRRRKEKKNSAKKKKGTAEEDAKHVVFDDSLDVREITDLITKKERGEFWFDGEEPPIVGDSGECYLCCFEPNEFEYLDFRVYATSDRWTYFVICPNCTPKPNWEFFYIMGATLNRCPSHVIANMFSFLPWKERWRLSCVNHDFQSACWSYFHAEDITDLVTLGTLISADMLSECTRTLHLEAPCLGEAGNSLPVAMLSQQIRYNDILESVTLRNCNLRAGQAKALVSSLKASVQSGFLWSVDLSQNFFPTSIDVLKPIIAAIAKSDGEEEDGSFKMTFSEGKLAGDAAALDALKNQLRELFPNVLVEFQKQQMKP